MSVAFGNVAFSNEVARMISLAFDTYFYVIVWKCGSEGNKKLLCLFLKMVESF